MGVAGQCRREWFRQQDDDFHARWAAELGAEEVERIERARLPHWSHAIGLNRMQRLLLTLVIGREHGHRNRRLENEENA